MVVLRTAHGSLICALCIGSLFVNDVHWLSRLGGDSFFATMLLYDDDVPMIYPCVLDGSFTQMDTQPLPFGFGSNSRPQPCLDAQLATFNV